MNFPFRWLCCRSSDDFDGFTLLEVLVILAITMVLSSLFFLSFQKVRLQAEATRCLSNIRTCGQALLLSASENAFNLPLPWGGDETTLTQEVFRKTYPDLANNPQFKKAWPDYLAQQGLISDKKILYCPSHIPRSKFSDDTKAKGEVPWGFAYGMRRYNHVPTQYLPMNSLKIPSPSTFVVLGDSIRSDDLQWYYTHHPEGGSKNQFHFRHNGRANFFFLDGSARSLTPQQLLDLGDGWREGVINTSLPLRN